MENMQSDCFQRCSWHSPVQLTAVPSLDSSGFANRRNCLVNGTSFCWRLEAPDHDILSQLKTCIFLQICWRNSTCKNLLLTEAVSNCVHVTCHVSHSSERMPADVSRCPALPFFKPFPTVLPVDNMQNTQKETLLYKALTWARFNTASTSMMSFLLESLQ